MRCVDVYVYLSGPRNFRAVSFCTRAGALLPQGMIIALAMCGLSFHSYVVVYYKISELHACSSTIRLCACKEVKKSRMGEE